MRGPASLARCFDAGRGVSGGGEKRRRRGSEECESCRRNRECRSGFCFEELCVVDRNPESIVRCRSARRGA